MFGGGTGLGIEKQTANFCAHIWNAFLSSDVTERDSNYMIDYGETHLNVCCRRSTCNSETENGQNNQLVRSSQHVLMQLKD